MMVVGYEKNTKGIIKSAKPPEITPENSMIAKKFIQPRCTLKSHFDGVRDIVFASKDPILASVSEVFFLIFSTFFRTVWLSYGM
jgi:hypothetical protein